MDVANIFRPNCSTIIHVERNILRNNLQQFKCKDNWFITFLEATSEQHTQIYGIYLKSVKIDKWSTQTRCYFKI
jgi:hypothetical protein